MQKIKTKKYGAGDQFKRIHLIAPKHPTNFWAMQGTATILGAKTLMPNAALATLMSLTPEDVCVEYSLSDENVGDIDMDRPCDLVAITGSTLHSERIHELCKFYKSKGIPVALGGTYASIEPEALKDVADHLFIGEAEYTWPRFLKEWQDGSAQAIYKQEDYIDMEDSPAPDWSLLNPKDYVNINIQTSRGCPNSCDFCDVIQYVGRQYRTKSVDQIIAEVSNAHQTGALTIFFSDDNFLGSRQFTKKLLTRLLKWNLAQARPLSFSTQITVQVADDEELLKMFADCRFSVLFVGVETVRKESLDEVGKSQNASRDIRERINQISRYGIVPFIGLIVGFDSDDESVFKELHDFIADTNSPIVGISLLNAPKHTPLYNRLKKAGRLTDKKFSGEWQLYTNIVPKQMTGEKLKSEYWSLFQEIYKPEFFDARLNQWLKNVKYFNVPYENRKGGFKQMIFATRIFKHFMFKENAEVRSSFFRGIKRTWKTNPRLMKRFFILFTQYSHFYNFVFRQAEADTKSRIS
jgi:radical SAM superfamily enzyme YgiQ (UPF0313 family)